MLNCRQIKEKSSDYLDHTLNRWQRLQMVVHLLVCYLCRRYIRQYRLTVDSIKQMPSVLSDEEASLFLQRLTSKPQSGDNDEL